MAWDEQFFIQPRLTSKLKHLVLRAYVKEFAYHLGSVRPVVYYVDGFAGAGVYGHGARTEDGSPLLIARLAQEISTYSRPVDLRCLNVESDLKRFRSLEAVTEPFRPGIVEKNYHGTFADAIPDVIKRIGNAPSFFFIDPFGTKDIAFSDLLPVFNRGSRTEVLITLHTDGIAKKAGYFARENAESATEKETVRKFTTHLAAALNIGLAKLRNGWLETGSKGDTEAFEARALSYYLQQLRSQRTRFEFTKAFKVLYYRQDSFVEAPVCFHLVFATQHQQGLFEMNDAMADAIGAFYREVYSDSFIPTFEAELAQRMGAAAVRREIEKVFSSKPFTVDDVKRHCMQETDYLVKGSGYRKLILGMAHDRDLRKIGKGPISNSQTKFEFARGVNQST
jgi:three-Cys-motif partner protein